MKKISLLSFAIIITSCSSLKRIDGPVPQPTPYKNGISSNGSWIGKVEVKTGFWCDVRGTILTFGSSGPTEAKATEIAMKQCQGVYKAESCKLVSCKPNK